MKASIPKESQRQFSDICRGDAIGVALLSQGPFVLEKGGIYLLELIERFELSKDFDFIVATNFFSWILNLRMRLVWVLVDAKQVAWLEVVPLNYPLAIQYGDMLANVRMCEGAYEESETILENESTAILKADIAANEKEYGGVLIAGPMNQIASPAIGAGILERIDWHGAIECTADGVILEPSHLYIVPVTKHLIHDRGLCAELIPYDPRTDKLQIWRKLFLIGLPWYGKRSPVLQKIVVQGMQVPFLLNNSVPIGAVRYFELDANEGPEVSTEDDGLWSLFIDRRRMN